THLAGRTLGEGDRQHLPGGDVSARDQLGDPVRDGARLAGSGAREHADRSARSQHGFTLFVIQLGGQWVGDQRHGVHLGSGGRQSGCIATPRITRNTYSPRPAHKTYRRQLGYPVMSTAAVTVYTTSWCGYCHRLMTVLKSNGIRYDAVDIEHDPAAAEFVSS